MEDIRIGRKASSIQMNEALGAASQTLVQDDSKRVTLLFPPPISGTITLSMRETAVAGEGIVIASTMPSLTLTIAEHGQMVTKSWQVIHSVGGINYHWFESQLVAE